MRKCVFLAHILPFTHLRGSMTTLPHVPHVARKKGYAPHYSPANLALFQPEMHQYTLQLVDVRVIYFSPGLLLTVRPTDPGWHRWLKLLGLSGVLPAVDD